MKHSKTYYPLRIKKKAVQMVAAGLLSEKEACQKFKINLKLLHEWQRCGSPPGYDEHQNINAMPKKKLSDKERIKQLEKQLKESQQQAKHEKLKREAYETMTVRRAIDIAEEEFNIKIEKKLGARVRLPNSPKNEAKTSW